jgi:hypothetical protein
MSIHLKFRAFSSARFPAWRTRQGNNFIVEARSQFVVMSRDARVSQVPVLHLGFLVRARLQALRAAFRSPHTGGDYCTVMVVLPDDDV